MSNVSKGQIQLPDEFKSGEPIRASEMDKLRQAIAFALKDMIGGGRGITVSQSAGKYLISARRQSSLRTPSHPFQVLPYKDGEMQKARIRYGTVNGEVPKIGTTELDPVLEDGPELTIPTGGDNIRVYLKVTISSSNFLISEITIGQAATLPDDTSTEGHVEIARILISDNVITGVSQQINTIVAYAYGGASTHFFFSGSA